MIELQNRLRINLKSLILKADHQLQNSTIVKGLEAAFDIE
jgi:hypothetical protein